ncbi:hypothetical protein [Pseudomonas sp. MN1F]|uniref:hypothetical protein n=1 Tax=Pseudomonas sp. MN1F TaxID=1366632 RepID=UPI00128F7147|nr:hypothetical protein [Pseudomonas sp. MN1F]MQG92118.1 hypothetical protein [Pseudomonas sp. MN1F]
MWLYSAAGRKQVISFISNMMSMGMVLGVMVFIAARTLSKNFEYYFLVIGLSLIVVIGVLLNMVDLMEGFADGDKELKSVKRLSQIEHGSGFGWFRSSLEVMAFCLMRRKLRILEGLFLAFVMVVIGMAMIMVALNIANGIPK